MKIFIVVCIVGLLCVGCDPSPMPESNEDLEEIANSPRGLSWGAKEGVDFWELFVSEDGNVDNAELKATVTEPVATCKDLQICGKDRWIHVRSSEGGVKSQFANLHWPSL